MLLLSLALASSLAAAPPAAPAPLPDIDVPFGRLNDVLGGPIEGGAPSGQTIVEFRPDGCEQTVSLNLTRMIGGVAFSLQQLQDWLGKTPGLEKQLFGAKSRLGEVGSRLARAAPAAKKLCAAPKLEGGYQLKLTKAARLCPAPGKTGEGDYWFLSDNQPFAAVQVSSAPADAVDRCLPRFSLVFFDKEKTARLRYHADFGGAVSATLIGDKCQNIDFILEPKAQVFHATRRSCKP